MNFFSSGRKTAGTEFLTEETIQDLGHLGGQPITIQQLVDMVKKFSDSNINDQIKQIDSTFVGAFDIDKSSLFRILSQDTCEGIRIYFSIVNDQLTLAFIGLSGNGNDLLRVDSNNNLVLPLRDAEEEVGKPGGKTLLQKAIEKLTK